MMPDLDVMLGNKLIGCEALDHGAWSFRFEGDFWITAETWWRLTSKEGVCLTREDHQQQFGLPVPVNAATAIFEIIEETTVTAVIVTTATSDLQIEFASGHSLEVLVSSSGHESWQLGGPSIGQIIATGGGEIAIIMGGG